MNKTTLTGIVVFFVIGVLIGTQLHGCKGHGATQFVPKKSDTVIRFLPRTDTLWHTIELTNNLPYTVWGHDTVFVRKTEHIVGHDTTWLTQYQFSTDTATYIDSIHEKNEFKAELFDTLYNNRIIGRQIRWANISPIEVKTVTNTFTTAKKPCLIKVYVGAETYGGRGGAKINVDLAPAASVVFVDRYMLDLGYYIFNQQFTAGLKVKLSFRK